MLAFGWASVSMCIDGELIEDWQKKLKQNNGIVCEFVVRL